MKRRSAFTIIEVLAALALLAILVTLIVSAMNTMRLRADWVRERTARQQNITVAIDRLTTALRTTMVEVPTIGAGVKGDANSIAVLSSVAGFDPSSEGDLARLSLTADVSARTLAGAWGPAMGEAEPSSHELGANAISRLRYHDGDAWRDSFDSGAAGRLPVAVEIAVWFANSEPREDELAQAEQAYPEREPDRRRVIAIVDARGDA